VDGASNCVARRFGSLIFLQRIRFLTVGLLRSGTLQ
jgi:hypothetical protein